MDEHDRPIQPAETPATPEGDQADWSDPRVRQPGGAAGDETGDDAGEEADEETDR